jgi:hypothetical protein
VYVEFVMTEARVHSYFSQLVKMKKDQKLDATTSLVVWQSYKGRLSKINELRFEIHRRKLSVCVSGKNKQQLIQILLENDKDVEEGQPNEEEIDSEYAAAAGNGEAEDDSSDEDETPNLDDPETLANFMDDFQS